MAGHDRRVARVTSTVGEHHVGDGAVGTVGSVERIRSLYGKVTDVHLAAAAQPVRADSLLD